MKKILAVMFAGLLALVGVQLGTATASADTPINQCVGTWNVVVGGLNNNESVGFPGANQRVGYFTYDTRAGISELNRLIWDHARACPGDRIRATGHSGGAAVVNQWGLENGQHFLGKVSLVLLADPKRGVGVNNPGFAATDFPFNLVVNGLAGANDNFRGLPRITVCRVNSDHICAGRVPWDGYIQGRHGAYDFDVNHYPWGANQVWDIMEY